MVLSKEDVRQIAEYLVANHRHDLRGKRGFSGDEGAKGDKGPAGLKGDRGPPGPKGNTGSCECLCKSKTTNQNESKQDDVQEVLVNKGTHGILGMDASSIGPATGFTGFAGKAGVNEAQGKTDDKLLANLDLLHVNLRKLELEKRKNKLLSKMADFSLTTTRTRLLASNCFHQDPLEAKVNEQGAKIRQMKTDKAPKDDVKREIEILQTLKDRFLAATVNEHTLDEFTLVSVNIKLDGGMWGTDVIETVQSIARVLEMLATKLPDSCAKSDTFQIMETKTSKVKSDEGQYLSPECRGHFDSLASIMDMPLTEFIHRIRPEIPRLTWEPYNSTLEPYLITRIKTYEYVVTEAQINVLVADLESCQTILLSLVQILLSRMVPLEDGVVVNRRDES